MRCVPRILGNNVRKLQFSYISQLVIEYEKDFLDPFLAAKKIPQKTQYMYENITNSRMPRTPMGTPIFSLP